MNSVINGNHGFNSTKFRVGKFIEFGGNFFNVKPVRDPDFGVDFSRLDDLDDFIKISGEGITRSEKHLLSSVENGSVWEGEVFRGNANIDYA